MVGRGARAILGQTRDTQAHKPRIDCIATNQPTAKEYKTDVKSEATFEKRDANENREREREREIVREATRRETEHTPKRVTDWQ